MNFADTVLKRGLRQGDTEVYKYLFMTHSPGLIRYGATLTLDTEIAREIVQDLFLELWEKRGYIIIKGSVKPYLYTSVYHRGLNWLRSKRIREIYASDPVGIRNWFASPGDPDPGDPLQLEIIEKEICLLPAKCREVFTRSAILGERNGEIASGLGLQVKTVENTLSRAKKILQGKLKKIL